MSILTQAANILDVSEYTILERAYRHWHGTSASFDLLNRTFSEYLVTNVPPFWARHYALDIISGFEAEMSAPSKFLHYFRFLFWDFKQQTIQPDNSLAA